MGSSINQPERRRQLGEESLLKVRIQGIRIVDSGYTTLSGNRGERQYVLVLNRRNNYSIRQRTVTDTSPDPDFDVLQTFKNNTDMAMKAWKKLKKDFDI